MEKGINYSSYLKISELLKLQEPLSEKAGRPAHDELLFIVIHQAYELWFKQLIHELDSVLTVFTSPNVDEREMLKVVSRLERINDIFKLLLQQVGIIETMTPMDFLEFRDLIYAASGFQSHQFRILENKLGLLETRRIRFHGKPYHAEVDASVQDAVRASEQVTLFAAVQSWLERTPFLNSQEFDFWTAYKAAVSSMFEQDRSFIANQPNLSSADKERLTQQIDAGVSQFEAVFDENAYAKLRESGAFRLSYRALHAALLIQLYREQPVFQLPYRMLEEIVEIDSHLTQWRSRHAIMVRRMLGERIGTGGSSGYDYLSKTVSQHRIFDDFNKLTTFLIPRTRIPELPKSFVDKMGFYFNSTTDSRPAAKV